MRNSYSFFMRNDHRSPWVLIEVGVTRERVRRIKQLLGRDARFEKTAVQPQALPETSSNVARG